jgi:hypothetical protein
LERRARLKEAMPSAIEAITVPAPPKKPRMTRKRIEQMQRDDPGWDNPESRDRLLTLLLETPALIDRYCEMRTPGGGADGRTADAGAQAQRRWRETRRRFLKRVDATVPELGKELCERILDHALERLRRDREAELARKGLIYRDTMTPTEYERFCARLLVARGWRAEATRASGDQGVDVVARALDRCLVVQAKKYASPVGNAAVQEVYAGMAHFRATFGVVVSTAGFTASARELAHSTNILLLHHDELATLSPWSPLLKTKI